MTRNQRKPQLHLKSLICITEAKTNDKPVVNLIQKSWCIETKFIIWLNVLYLASNERYFIEHLMRHHSTLISIQWDMAVHSWTSVETWHYFIYTPSQRGNYHHCMFHSSREHRMKWVVILGDGYQWPLPWECILYLASNETWQYSVEHLLRHDSMLWNIWDMLVLYWSSNETWWHFTEHLMRYDSILLII